MPGANYEEIAADLRTAIEAGTYPTGSYLPHTDALQAKYGAGAGAISLATRILRDARLVHRVGNHGLVEGRPVIVNVALNVAASSHDP